VIISVLHEVAQWCKTPANQYESTSSSHVLRLAPRSRWYQSGINWPRIMECFWLCRTRAMQNYGYELPRTPTFQATSVNKGKEKAGAVTLRPSASREVGF
jgi:hypothetical protein